MRIAFDVDGVLNDVESFQSLYGTRYFARKYRSEHGLSDRCEVEGLAVNPDGYGVRQVFGCSGEEEAAFWKRHAVRFALLWPPRKNAARTLRRLRREGHGVWIFSSRAGGFWARRMLGLWLGLNGFGYDDIVRCPPEGGAAGKRAACERLGIDVLVEDGWEDADEARKSATVLCFLSRANCLHEAENVVRVDNFNGVLGQVRRLQRQRDGLPEEACPLTP